MPISSVGQAWREVGAAGEAAFVAGWANISPGFGNFETAGYRRDSEGFVYLKGVVIMNSGASFLIFTLPSGFRPANDVAIAVLGGSGTNNSGRLTIGTDGTVTSFTNTNTQYISLGNIQFRGA